MGAHSELGALAGQVGEQVGGGRQTGGCHVGVGRVRQLMKTANSLQTARSIRASEETNQKMHAVLLPRGKTDLHTDMAHEKQRYKWQIHHFNTSDVATKVTAILDEGELRCRVAEGFTQGFQVGLPLRPAVLKSAEQTGHVLGK